MINRVNKGVNVLSRKLSEIIPKNNWPGLRKVGHQLSQMLMPHLSIFIALALMNLIASFGFEALRVFLDSLEYALISYLLPLLIGYTGGKQIEPKRGGTIAGIATIGMILGTTSPQIIGAMIVGPLSVWSYVSIRKHCLQAFKDGYEMLVTNIVAGVMGAIWCLVALFFISPIINTLMERIAILITELIHLNLLPLVSFVIEPLKIFFFNNTINHGVLTPIGLSMVEKTGQSILFLLETNPGPGLGVLLAYYRYGKKKAQTGGAALIHLIGGIHEVYFPYVLMEPRLFIAIICSGMTGTAIFNWFNVGLKNPISPGSLILMVASTPVKELFGLFLGITLRTFVSFEVAQFFLKQKKWEESDLSFEELPVRRNQEITRIIVACDAGIGSSAMGASLLRRSLEQEGSKLIVDYQSVYTLENRQDTLVVVHPQLKQIAEKKVPATQIITIENFLETKILNQRVKEALGISKRIETTSYQVSQQGALLPKIVFLYANQMRGSQTMAIELWSQKAQHYQRIFDFQKEAIQTLNPNRETIYILSQSLMEKYPELGNLAKKIVVADILQVADFETLLEKGEI